MHCSPGCTLCQVVFRFHREIYTVPVQLPLHTPCLPVNTILLANKNTSIKPSCRVLSLSSPTHSFSRSPCLHNPRTTNDRSSVFSVFSALSVLPAQSTPIFYYPQSPVPPYTLLPQEVCTLQAKRASIKNLSCTYITVTTSPHKRAFFCPSRRRSPIYFISFTTRGPRSFHARLLLVF